jgi:hypothetical protein
VSIGEGFYLVITTPHAEMAEEYHAWYENEHIPDIMNIPFVAYARRLRIEHLAESGSEKTSFAAFYGFRDIEAAVNELAARRGTERLRSSKAVDAGATRSCVFDGFLDDVGACCEAGHFGFALADHLLLDESVRFGSSGAGAGTFFARASSLQARPGPAPFSGIQIAKQAAQIMHPAATRQADPISAVALAAAAVAIGAMFRS